MNEGRDKVTLLRVWWIVWSICPCAYSYLQNVDYLKWNEGKQCNLSIVATKANRNYSLYIQVYEHSLSFWYWEDILVVTFGRWHRGRFVHKMKLLQNDRLVGVVLWPIVSFDSFYVYHRAQPCHVISIPG